MAVKWQPWRDIYNQYLQFFIDKDQHGWQDGESVQSCYK